MKKTVTSKVLTGLLAILMVFAMIPVTTEAVFAEGDEIPLLKIVMYPGDGTGDPITVTSRDEGLLDEFGYESYGHFSIDRSDPSKVWYRCTGKPDSFNGPSGGVFIGWAANGAIREGSFCSGKNGDTINLTAFWSHTVSFDSKCGIDIPTQTVIHGNKASKPEEELEREGWTFLNWYSSSEASAPYNFEAAVTSNLQLTALWGKEMGARVLDLSNPELSAGDTDCGTIGVKTSVSAFDTKGFVMPLPEGSVTFTAKPKEGYYFVGWYKGYGTSSGTPKTTNTEFTTTVGGDIYTLTAVFSHNHSSATRNENEVGPTCTQPGGYDVVEYCTICGNELNRTHVETSAATGHEFADDFTVDLAPTCTEKGSKSKHCTHENCDAKADVTEIPMIDHSYGDWSITRKATCVEDGSKERVCEVCGHKDTEAIGATGHVWDSAYTVDKAATRTAAGSKSIHCKVCKAVKPGSVQTIAKLPPKEIRNLAAVKISKPSAGKKKVTVKWKKVSKKNQKKIQGIEIQVATDSKFKNIVKRTTAGKNKVSKTVKGLKSKKTYWVRIRAYKNASGSKYVSAWKVKKVKVK